MGLTLSRKAAAGKAPDDVGFHSSCCCQCDIAVGNVVGSNIFNILAVLGLSAALSAHSIMVPDSARQFDLPVMIAVAVACLPIFFTGYRIDRWEGGLFFAYYLAYVVYLVLDATRPEALRIYKVRMLIFVMPLTALTLLVLTLHGVHGRKRAG